MITAKERIPVRTVITADMLEVAEMPSEYIYSGTVTDKKDAAGKIAASDIFPGETILSAKILSREESAAGLSAKIEENKRAITIPVNNTTALNGLIYINDHVDVLVTFNSPDEEKKPVTSTIIQNVPVLAVNKNLNYGAASKDEPETITLMVTPEEAQQIALSIQQGSIQLVLRSLEDENILPVSSGEMKHLIR